MEELITHQESETPEIFKVARVKSIEELRAALASAQSEKSWRQRASDLLADSFDTSRQIEYWERVLADKRAEAQGYEHAYSSPMQRVSIPAEQLAIKLAAKAACEQQVADCHTIVEAYRNQRAEKEREAYAVRALLSLADVLSLKKRPDERVLRMLPSDEREKIEAHWRRHDEREQLKAERQHQAEIERQRQAEIEAQERLAAVENYSLDELLDAVFDDPRDYSLWQLQTIPTAFRARTLTAVQYHQFAQHKPDDPIKARAVERLLEIGAEIVREAALAPLPAPPTDEEVEAEREREIQAYLAKLDEMHFSGLVGEANKRAIISPELFGRLTGANLDTGTRTAISQHLKEKLAQLSDPIHRGIIERLIARIGAVGSGFGQVRL